MANKLVHSNRIGARTMPITLTADGTGCYTWTQHGRIITLANGSEQVYLNCAGCRSVIQKKGAAKKTIKTVKFNRTSGEWIDTVDGYDHFCTPKNLNKVKGVDVRRSVEAEIAAGVKETAVAARVRINSRVHREYGRDEGFKEIQEAACGNVVATQLALYRAKRKRFPNVRTYQELLAVKNQTLQYTLRGMEAVAEDDNFQEKLLLYGGII